MLRITADVFSGRPNPSATIQDEAEVRAALREISRTPNALAGTGDPGHLGLRGFVVESLSDELAQDFGLGSRVYVPAGPAAADTAGSEIAERLIELLGRGEAVAAADDVAPIDAALQDFLRTQLHARGATHTDAGDVVAPAAPEEDEATIRAAACQIEFGAFNPGFWNNDPNVRSRNNCYNYASNKRTDTFAQPGRGCGNMYTAITCAEVSRGALCDGLHRRYHCFPDSEKPRYLVAMVVAPGPGFIDYHWYRKQKEGFWGHKPGGTAARNTDNSNRVITDPRTCDRGPYTQFCGFFYTCRSQRIG